MNLLFSLFSLLFHSFVFLFSFVLRQLYLPHYGFMDSSLDFRSLNLFKTFAAYVKLFLLITSGEMSIVKSH